MRHRGWSVPLVIAVVALAGVAVGTLRIWSAPNPHSGPAPTLPLTTTSLAAPTVPPTSLPLPTVAAPTSAAPTAPTNPSPRPPVARSTAPAPATATATSTLPLPPARTIPPAPTTSTPPPATAAPVGFSGVCAVDWQPGAPTPTEPCTLPSGRLHTPLILPCVDGRTLSMAKPGQTILAGYVGDRLFIPADPVELAGSCDPTSAASPTTTHGA